MAAGIEIYNYVTNQKGSPALYSDVFANRPAAGFIGRLFISTDTLEIYRDNGTTWDLISGGGGPSVNIYNSDGTLLADRTMTMAGYNLIFEGGANTNRVRMSANAGQARIFSFASANVARWAFRVDGAETGSNAGADWALRSYNDAGTFVRSPLTVTRSTGEKSLLAEASLTAGTNTFTGTYQIGGATYAAGLTMIGGNPHGAEHNNFTLANSGSLTFANSIYLGAQSNVLRLQGNASGTITMQAASPGIRTAASTLNQIQYNTSTGAALTYTHVSVMQALGIYRLFAAGSLTVTNGYGLIINDLNEYGYAGTGAGALSITNRWGIYQDSTTDVNYLGGTTLIGTTTNAGYKFDVNGSIRAQGTDNLVTLQGTDPAMSLKNSTKEYLQQLVNANNRFRIFDNTASVERLTLTTTGDVGIGQVVPAYKLDVNGTLRTVNGVVFASSSGQMQVGTTSWPTALIGQSGSRSLIGNEGIFILWNEAAAAANNVAGLYLGAKGGGTNGSTTIAGGVIKGLAESASTNAGALTFETNGGSGNIERMRITSSGKLLINTTTDAGQRVQIDSSLRLVPTSTVPTASAGAMYYDSATNKLKLYDGTNWVDLN